MFESSQSSGILRSEAYLTTRHTPEEPVGRDQELSRIAGALRPLTRRKPAENLLIHGPAGVGKTTCVRHAFDQLEAETRVTAAYINCWQYNTRPSLLTELLIQVGYPAPRKGKPTDELLSRLRELLEKSGGFAVALDEFDQLDDPTEILYDLQLVCEDIDQELGLILVSNQHPSGFHLDPRSESRISLHTLEFRPYTAPELVDILEQRIEEAFRPGTVADEAVEFIAEHVADRSGDCREALELLLRAGREADQEGQQELNKTTVEGVK